MLVAVYGTLKKGYFNHDGYMREATFKGNAWVRNYVMLKWGELPAAVPMPYGKVYTEVYEVTPGCLARLDKLEGIDSSGCYLRDTVSTPYGQAYMYRMSISQLKKGADWFETGVWHGRTQHAIKFLGWLEEKDNLRRRAEKEGINVVELDRIWADRNKPIPQNIATLPGPVHHSAAATVLVEVKKEEVLEAVHLDRVMRYGLSRKYHNSLVTLCRKHWEKMEPIKTEQVG